MSWHCSAPSSVPCCSSSRTSTAKRSLEPRTSSLALNLSSIRCLQASPLQSRAGTRAGSAHACWRRCAGRRNVALALIDHPWMTPIRQLAAKLDVVTADFTHMRWLGDRKGIEE